MENQEHIHQFVSSNVPATCVEPGYTLSRCTICGYEHKSSFTPASSHKFEVVSQKNPTCTDSGSQQIRCSVCGTEETRTCPPLGHDWGQWALQTLPTCTAEGSQIRTCSRCGDTESESIKPLGHNLINPQKSQAKKGHKEYFCANCGETILKKTVGRRIRNWAIILGVLAALTAGFIFLALPHLKPLYHYTVAKNKIEKGKYKDAYIHLMDCGKDYKDVEDLLDDFIVVWQTCTSYDEDGEVIGEQEMEYDDYGNLLSQIIYDEDGEVISEREMEYDDYGNLLSKIYYNEDGEIFSEYTYDYVYNEDDTVASETEHLDNVIRDKWEYTYDSNGNLTKTVHYDADGNKIGEEIYKYNENNINVYYASYNRTGTIAEEYTYNDQGNLTRVVSYNADGEKDGEYKYKYNDQGMRTSEAFYNADGEKDGECKYKYNDQGNLSSVVFYNADGEKDGEYKYKYNDDGFMIEKSVQNYEFNNSYSDEYSDYLVFYRPNGN